MTVVGLNELWLNTMAMALHGSTQRLAVLLAALWLWLPIDLDSILNSFRLPVDCRNGDIATFRNYS